MMNTVLKSCFFISFLLFAVNIQAATTTVNPLEFGLKDAKSGIERYKVLYNCHEYAVQHGCKINYAGIKTISLEIPANFKSIPVAKYTDFCGVEIKVKNNSKKVSLFMLRNVDTTYVEVNRELLNINKQAMSADKTGLLLVFDQNPWVAERKGHGYAAIRADMFLVENGVIKNDPIYNYLSSVSRPKAYFTKIDPSRKTFKNITFSRDSQSTEITNLLKVEGQFNVEICNVTVNTPENSSLVDDRIIRLENDYSVSLRNLKFNGTYSLKRHSGYGIYINNVYDLKVFDMYARANWGIFGTNNLNNALLEGCDINRMDIHCYGRDVTMRNCKFSYLYNQFSSVFGNVVFENCSFIDFTPFLMEDSYNAYTPFDLTFDSCTFNLTSKKNFIVNLRGLEASHNSRPELFRKALPNITIKNSIVNLSDDVKKWYIVNTGMVSYKEPLDYINEININELVIYGNADYEIFSTDMKTTKPLKENLGGIRIKTH